MTPAFHLGTALEDLPGITARTARSLRSLGITNLGRLVAYLPMRHEHHAAEAAIAELVPGQIVSARGEVTATRPVRGRRPRFEAVLVDTTGRLDLVWFNQPYRAESIHPGVRLRVQGRLARRGPQLQIVNAKVEVLRDEAEPDARAERLRPVYPASELVPSTTIERAIAGVLDLALPLIDDHLPEPFRRERSMPELREAYRIQHTPRSEAEIPGSRRRLAYDELLMLQLAVHTRRWMLRTTLRAPALRIDPEIDRHIRARFPFALTPGQEQAIGEISRDLSLATPANRLVQGDVGSGKTVVALYALLLAVASGLQGAIMAPTEILAEQHFASISRMLAGSRVRVELLTGDLGRAERESLLARLEAGDVDLLVGTHALLTESVRFKDLGVVVIDEQHRFGVHQRSRLREKGSDSHSTPHVLVMTATPIPRTLAITLFGDLDVSIIRGLPPGRRPTQTTLVPEARRTWVYESVRDRLDAGEQAFVVAPAIEPGGTREDDGDAPAATPAIPARDVRTLLNELEAGPWRGKRLAALHGRLRRDMREAIMERFRLGQIDALIATTVVEVGVDVPNASVMIVEQADRFGLAQLHQLRGRVGRGTTPGACFLISDPPTPEAQQRLGVMGMVSDGFLLAEKDLEIRGPGELFGVRQSGMPPLRIADLARDRDLLELARRDAAEWISHSPHLAAPDEALLRRRMLKAHGQWLGLGDVG